MQSTESLTTHMSEKGNELLHNVYNIDKQNSSLLGRLVKKKTTKVYPVKDGKCSNCECKLDLQTIAEYQPEKVMIQKFESLMLGRQRTMFGNIMKDLGERAKRMEKNQDGETMTHSSNFSDANYTLDHMRTMRRSNIRSNSPP